MPSITLMTLYKSSKSVCINLFLLSQYPARRPHLCQALPTTLWGPTLLMASSGSLALTAKRENAMMVRDRISLRGFYSPLTLFLGLSTAPCNFQFVWGDKDGSLIALDKAFCKKALSSDLLCSKADWTISFSRVDSLLFAGL